jgi:uncharacterized membrane protein YfcA
MRVMVTVGIAFMVMVVVAVLYVSGLIPTAFFHTLLALIGLAAASSLLFRRTNRTASRAAASEPTPPRARAHSAGE